MAETKELSEEEKDIFLKELGIDEKTTKEEIIALYKHFIQMTEFLEFATQKVDYFVDELTALVNQNEVQVNEIKTTIETLRDGLMDLQDEYREEDNE